jgi:hypothetical protein
MLIHSIACVETFVERLDQSLKVIHSSARLTSAQRRWLSIVLTGILVTHVLCWAVFERRGLGRRFGEEQLRWMFKRSQIAWSYLLQASVRCIIEHYGIKAGTLVIDDSDKRRAKITKRIPGAHKIKDKKTGGYFNGQELIFMLLVTDIVTLPIDFRFYVPDPAVSAWRKKVKEQKKQGIAAKEREKRPLKNDYFPSKMERALEMIQGFTKSFPEIKIRAVLADALYGNAAFMDQAATATQGAQVISELRSNQLIISRGKAVPLTRYFARQEGVSASLNIRGQKNQPVVMAAARLHVKAHGKKRFVIALRYADEKEYRFLVATDLSWRHHDIAELFSLRWLVEVFIEDWKAHGGWNHLTKHQGDEGSTHGVILSLLCDHVLLLHDEHSPS